MNTEVYLILIAALLIVAALMLYARFISREDEISKAAEPSEGTGIEAASETITIEDASQSAASDSTIDSAPVAIEPIGDGREDHDDEKDYLDELQEAAAGLAMLMRSSPVAERSTPVVFAPADEEDFVEEQPRDVAEAPDAEKPSEVADVIGRESEETVFEAERSGSVEQPPEGETVETDHGASPPLIELLGEEVVERIHTLDHALNELESLVSGMEESLISLDFSAFDDVEEERVEEAA